ncbi:MAG TPA: DNA polymerase/3'-5' exonuclease PolX [Nitrospira sp.]|nr:DNA polymerase/3'-5' exonuclease PolX [Nitrospira sp.]
MALSTGLAPVEKPREQSSEISSERTKIIHRVDMMMTKRDIAHILSEIAFYLRLKQDNPYKSLAYERAARALLTCLHEPHQLLAGDALTEIPGIGRGTAAVIRELLITGASSLHQTIKGSYPSSLVELGDVPGLRPTQIRRLYEEAGIRSVADLKAACRKNQLLDLKGIGPKIQAKIQAALGEFQRGQGYELYANVLAEASKLEKDLKTLEGVETVAIAGALRRKMEVINAFHFVISWPTGRQSAEFITGLKAIPNVSTVVSAESRFVTATSPTGLPIRITLAASADQHFHLLQATGSEEHLEQVLVRFAAQGLDTWDKVRRRVKTLSEKGIYASAGLPFIPPELREGRGELEVNATKKPPKLIEPSQIEGFFHFHTDYSDGVATVEEMVEAARHRGYRYIGISDHSQSAFYANGLKEARIRQQWAEIETVQEKYPDIHIFKGIEADILPDGTMDYADALLSEFDFVIASVHSRFNLSEADQTRRVCRALSNPYVTMFGHPTGRLLLSRSGYRLDMRRVLDAAKEYGKVLEINGSRHRLDLDWRDVRLAKAHGIKFSINPDAHAVNELDNVTLGVNVARKGGLNVEDVINTQSLSAMKTFLRTTRSSETTP